jgi:Tfp pilus assembly protein FimT
MSTPAENQPRHERRWIYIGAVIVLIGLTLGGILAFSTVRQSARASEKADELIAAIEEAGGTAPAKDQITRVLGSDGGATCANPNEALSRATLLAQLANGATGPGSRPVIADSRIVQGQLLIIEVYCPDELDDFKAFVENLKTADVAGT